MIDAALTAVAQMPRGGPQASWLDRKLQTTALEYTDRDDVADSVKQKVITSLARMGTRAHHTNATYALALVADIPHPRILELGAGHGRLSAQILELHPTATVTITDVDPTSVSNIAASELGTNPRVTTRVIDATAIDAEDASFDVVVLAQAFHHLPPETACRAIAEATRVGNRFLVVDLKRHSPPVLLLTLAAMAPWFPVVPVIHDGLISSLRAYSRAAFTALAKAVDPRMRVQFLPAPPWSIPGQTVVAFARPGTTLTPISDTTRKDAARP